MASILLALTLLATTSIKDARQKRSLEKRHRNDARFDELERENAARIARLQATTCFCAESDWRGEGCEVHGGGYVPAGAFRGERREEEEGGQLVDGGVLEGRRGGGDAVDEEEERRMKINEERRRRMKTGGFTNWVLRRKKNGRIGGTGAGAGEEVVLA